jgi:hypothetical protein
MSVLHPRHHYVQSIDFAEDRSAPFQLCPLMRTSRAFRYFRPIWNGKAKNATRSIDRVRKVMHVYKDELGQHTRNAPFAQAVARAA